MKYVTKLVLVLLYTCCSAYIFSQERAKCVSGFSETYSAPAKQRNGSTRPRIQAPSLAVFGDSLSDPGNAFALWQKETQVPYDSLDTLYVPTYPYATGHRYTNGFTWIEQFASNKKAKANSQAAFQSLSNKTHLNFAVGKARARRTLDSEQVNLPAQVDAFIQKTQGAKLTNTLCIVEMGINDIRDALVSKDAERPTIITAAINSIDRAIRALYARGARTFVVCNSPDIGTLPAIQTLEASSPGIVVEAGTLTNLFNTALKTSLQALARLQDITIAELDMYQSLNQMVAQPQEYGLKEVRTPYLKAQANSATQLNPDEYLFWDGVHGTKQFHKALAQQLASIIKK